MMNVIGLPLDRAKEKLTDAGIAFVAEETRCKKGVEGGNDARVIRQTLLEDGRISLIYAVFRTEPAEDEPSIQRGNRN